MPRESGFTPILVILLLAVLVVGGFFVYRHSIVPTLEPVTQLKPTPSTPSESTSADMANWKTLNCFNQFTLKYPESFYLDSPEAPCNPGFYIADSVSSLTAYHATHFNAQPTALSFTNNSLVLSGISLNLDRHIDPINNPNLLAAPQRALQRQMNLDLATFQEVSGTDNIAWENSNGGTASGMKFYYPNISYENIKLGSVIAAKVVKDNIIYYYIVAPKQDSFIRLEITPTDSKFINTANQIMSTFKFTDQNTDLDSIKVACSKIYNDDPTKIRLTINDKSSKYAGQFAMGTYGAEGQAGGGIYFAAKVNGEWACPFVGNGTISCTQIENYNFPADLIPVCFDSKGDLVKR